MSDRPPVKIPSVARKPRRAGATRFAVALVIVGGGVFAGLANSRAARSAQLSNLPPLSGGTTSAPVPLPPQFAPGPSASVPLSVTAPPSVAVQPSYPGAVTATSLDRSDSAAAERAQAALAAPALIVDLAQARSGENLRAMPVVLADSGAPASIPTASLNDPAATSQTGDVTAAGGTLDPAASGAPAPPGARDLNNNERFLNRAGGHETEVVRGRRLPNQDTLVVQGTIFGAVMETALNSDLPGFARAVTSRDVLSFDGSKVMIPAGSHVIGEYNSGVAQGASRVFIVWTRLIRPDGVSISLASPAVDDLGRGGLGGKVNRHFLQRFGGAILLSVLTGGLNAFTQSLAHGSTVVVSNSTDATSLAGQAAQSTDIPPTIKTKQGTTVRIFVARDLDFSDVGPAL